MKTEVVKLPDFYGEPGKDTITALEFLACIDQCQVTNKWNDITTFSYFRLALRGQADKWLSLIVPHLQLTAAQKTWTRIRPVFKAEFAAFSDDKLIIDGLAKLSHRRNENPRMFFLRLEEMIFVLKENCASYRVNPECPQPQAQGGYTEDRQFDQVCQRQRRLLRQFHVHTDVQGCCSRKRSTAPFSQGSNKARHGRRVQGFLHRPQAGDGQKGFTGACSLGRARFLQSGTTARHCVFQTSTKATKQAATELKQQGQQLIMWTRLQSKLQQQQPPKLQSAQIKCFKER